MNNSNEEHEILNDSKSNPNSFQTLYTFQEANPSDSVTILRAFLHLTNPINQEEYSSDFVVHQLNRCQQCSTPLIPSLVELLKQFVPSSDFILSFNALRQPIIESWINQFRKDTQKQKWGGNGEKIQLLANLFERSLNLYYTNDNMIKNTIHIWYSIVLNSFEPLIDELNEYLKNKLDKQQFLSFVHLLKPLSQVCEQLDKIDEEKNCMIINEYFSNILLANLQQRIDFILNKKIFEQFDSFDKLEGYKCPLRQSTFTIYPDVSKLLLFFNDVNISKSSMILKQKCNEKLSQLLDKASSIFHTYPTSTSLEHCICLISSLSSIEILYSHEQFQYFLYNFSQFILNYWKINLLHDCDANDRLNTKSYVENQRYSVYIDTLFHHFIRFHSYLKQYCPNLLSIFIPHMLLDLMKFFSHRYASMQISYARQNQYRTDLLALLVHASEFSHYFVQQNSPIKQFVLFQNDHLESKFLHDGNEILAAIVLVTCPCSLLYEQLENATRHRSTKLQTKISWLNVIRPDWFDMNNELRIQIKTYLLMKSIIETKQNYVADTKVLSSLIEYSELDAFQSVLIQMIMKNEQWELINVFVKHQRDWSFMNNLTMKLPEWLVLMMKYWMEFFAKCCYLCANEKDMEWRSKIQTTMLSECSIDEKSIYLKSLQQYLANIPLSLYHLLTTINQHHSQFTKRTTFARLLYQYMIDLKIDRAAIYYSFLTGKQRQFLIKIELELRK
ncbi:unnamed protein product [Adineta ricciae]|uniref:Uncharacterized protein n=1 Tax=Adineta ricciae TaxID=249248 RepID=A0A813WNB8_ADIRI|nr:unnamed protein product [Adineta ricciae]